MGRFNKYLGEGQEIKIDYADGTSEVLKLNLS